jgi:uncharacterized protein (DUF2267 family)
MTRIRAFERTLHTSDRWVGDMAKEMGEPEDQAYGAMRAVLHTLRDRLPHNESAHLAAQLPTLVRGVYYEGWRPSETPMGYHAAEEFLVRVAHEGRLSGGTEASVATSATMTVLREHVENGEMQDVLAVLPPPIRSLLSSANGNGS